MGRKGFQHPNHRQLKEASFHHWLQHQDTSGLIWSLFGAYSVLLLNTIIPKSLQSDAKQAFKRCQVTKP